MVQLVERGVEQLIHAHHWPPSEFERMTIAEFNWYAGMLHNG